MSIQQPPGGNMKTTVISTLAAAIAASAIFAAPAVQAGDHGVRHYAITVTNLTRAQPMAPPAVVAHNDDYRMFTLGSPGGPELAQLAEAGNGMPVLDAASAMPSVYATDIGSGGILPGTSQTIEIVTTKRFSEISIGAMLGSTNDGFMAVRGVELPARGEVTVEAIGYDAGTEANSDSCAFIPGPPCGDTSHNPAAAEGYVFVHAGMHGINNGVYNPSQLDWRNPVALIQIKRMD
jgi:hypothetical protein